MFKLVEYYGIIRVVMFSNHDIVLLVPMWLEIYSCLLEDTYLPISIPRIECAREADEGGVNVNF